MKYLHETAEGWKPLDPNRMGQFISSFENDEFIVRSVGTAPSKMSDETRDLFGVFIDQRTPEPDGVLDPVETITAADGAVTSSWTDSGPDLEYSARVAIDQIAGAGQAAGIEIIIPAGSTIDFQSVSEPATIRVALVHPKLGDSYWPTNRDLFDARSSDKQDELIEYDGQDSDGNPLRFGILGRYVPSLMNVIAVNGSQKRTGWLNLERLFELQQYQAVIDAVAAAAGAPAPEAFTLVE